MTELNAEDVRISPSDWRVLVASLIQFGRSPDGSVERDLFHSISTAITAAERRGERRGLDRAVEIARDRLERIRNHGPNIELNQDTPGYDYYRAGSLVASEVIMNTIRALAQETSDE